MTRDLATTRICDHLEKYVFDKIWNDPYTEYRTFTVLDWLTKFPTTGVFHGRYGQVQLPSKVTYRPSNSTVYFYIYVIPATMFGQVHLNALDWVTLSDFCTDNLIDIEIFNTAGRRCPRAGIFIKQYDKNDGILVAIETTAYRACFGSTATPDNTKVIFGEMFDSDLHPSVKYTCSKLRQTDLPKNGTRSRDYDPVTDGGTPTYATYNGKLLTGKYQNQLAAGALIERVYDENIIGTVTSYREKVYYSSPDSQPRILIHIPKDLNPKRVIITPNTCDIYMVPLRMHPLSTAKAELSGVYIYQCGRREHFHQLTHNDFGIDREFLDEIAHANDIEDYEIRVYVRILDQEKLAIRDANYVNILYINSDAEIEDFLLGRADFDIPFWTATALENGLYDYAVQRRRSTGVPYSIDDYIDLIGYYHTLALVGKHVHYFEVTLDTPANKEFVVRAPLALVEYEYDDYMAVVYKNGYRVDQSKISLKTGANCDNRYCKELVFTPDATWWTKVIDVCYSQRIRVIVDEELKVGDQIVIEIYDNQKNSSFRKVTLPELNFNPEDPLSDIVLSSDTVYVAGKEYYQQKPSHDGTSEYRYVYLPYSMDDVGKPIDPDYPVFELNVSESTRDAFRVQMTTEEDWKVFTIMNDDGHHEEQPDHHAEELRKIYKAYNAIFEEVENPGLFDVATKTLMISSRFNGKSLIIIDGNKTVEDIGEKFDVTNHSLGYLGDSLWPDPYKAMTESIPGELDSATCNIPLDSELVLLNNQRLIRWLDYTMDGYIPDTRYRGAKLFLQNVSYLQKEENEYNVIRSTQNTLSQQRGYLKGNIVYWNHQNPFWFDELSVLTIDGVVCSDIAHDFGTITLLKYHNAEATPYKMRKDDPKYLGEKFRPYNGAPFEFRMTVSARVKKLVGNHGEDRDRERLRIIKAYYDAKFKKPFHQTIVKKAHKIYSLYLEQIITAYFKDPYFDFTIIQDPTFFEQFIDFTDWKEKDVSFNFTEDDFKYVDIYPLYNRLETTDRYQYRKISELARRLMPVDRIKHKDIHNVK